MDDATRTRDQGVKVHRGPAARPALVVVWSAVPNRAGEALVFDKLGQSYVFGRGGSKGDDPHPRLLLVRQRPGANRPTEPLDDPFMSRVQLHLSAQAGSVVVRNEGKPPLIGPEGNAVVEHQAQPGELIEIEGQLVLMCCMRPYVMPAAVRARMDDAHAFGRADGCGFVGESPEAWALRDRVAFLAGRSAHVLLLGGSGTGKEIAARAIHALSARRGKRMVSRNAATLPAGIVDAELFGNVANYPNAGTPERQGLVGEADGSTLFLDEIGELSEDLQTRLLRLLDANGEYQRLGEARTRATDIRFIGATNRTVESLREDLAARLRLRLELPTLDQRREDIPLLAAHLVRTIADDDPDAAQQFMADDGPRLSRALVRALVTHPYRAGVREIESALWCSIGTSPGTILEMTDATREQLDRAPGPMRVRPDEVTVDEVRTALDRAGGVQERAWRDLGLANRHVLRRLMKKLGLENG